MAIAILLLLCSVPFIIYRIQENAQIAILETCITKKLDEGVSDDGVMRECLVEIQQPKIEQLSECAERKFKEKVPDDVAEKECLREIGITSWDMKAFDRLYEYKMEDVEDSSASSTWKQ